MKRRNPRSGYALLFILMMSAAIAIALYAQLPRVAFESQRDREQLLIDRGEQYKRAIQLYVRKFNRFPADMRALENTQNIRFLRKQYVDPMTGKNEWRLIHVGPNGALLDSAVSPNTGKTKGAPDNFITELAPIGGGNNPNPGVNQATRRRPEDGGPSGPFDPNNPNPAASATPTGPVMVLPDGRIVPANSTGLPPPTGPATTNGPLPGQPAQPGQSQPGLLQQGQPQPGQPVIPGQIPGSFANTPNGPQGGAANLINQILTTPRPGGFNGIGGDQSGGGAPGVATGGFQNNTGTALPGMGGTTVGGGIAGVASKLEQEGIKIYNQRTAYNEWEFIYDMSKDKSRGGNVPGQQMQQPQNGLQSGQQPGFGSPIPPAGAPKTLNGSPSTSQLAFLVGKVLDFSI